MLKHTGTISPGPKPVFTSYGRSYEGKPMMVTTVVLYLAAMVALLSSLKQLLSFYHLPNFFSLLKDVAILFALAVAMRRSRLLFDPKMMAIGLLFIAFISYYLMSSAFESRLFIGLYYLRIYLLPVLFFVACRAAISTLERGHISKLLNYWFITNFLVIIAAFTLYYVLLTYPSAWQPLFGGEFLGSTWYISGARMLRMGLPMGSPNGLGVYLAITLYLMVTALSVGQTGCFSRKVLYFLLALNLIALVLTFSRSSALLLAVSLGMYLLVVNTVSKQAKFVILKYSIVALILGAASLLVINEVSNGQLTKWLALNAKMTDPSMLGHASSVGDALGKIDEYYLYGYERGTVGPKAVLFSNVMMNVENSTLILLYDFGIFAFFVFLLAYALLLMTGYSSRLQIPLLVGLIVDLQFLPIIMSGELLMCFMFVYLLLGRLSRDQVEILKREVTTAPHQVTA